MISKEDFNAFLNNSLKFSTVLPLEIFPLLPLKWHWSKLLSREYNEKVIFFFLFAATFYVCPDINMEPLFRFLIPSFSPQVVFSRALLLQHYTARYFYCPSHIFLEAVFSEYCLAFNQEMVSTRNPRMWSMARKHMWGEVYEPLVDDKWPQTPIFYENSHERPWI